MFLVLIIGIIAYISMSRQVINRRLALGLVSATLLVLGGYAYWRWQDRNVDSVDIDQLVDSGPLAGTVEHNLQQLVSSEELILELTPRLSSLSRGMFNLQLPDYSGRELFHDNVEVWDLASGQPTSSRQTEDNPLVALGILEQHWPLVASSKKCSSKELQLWRPLIDTVSSFERAKFYLVRGRFDFEDPNQFLSDVGFTGLTRCSDGPWQSVHARQQVTWIRCSSDHPSTEDVWRIVSWKTTDVKVADVSQTLFQEVLDQALPNSSDRERARRSIHEELVVTWHKDQRLPLDKKLIDYFQIDSAGRHPAVAVVDIDRDGLDDLYIMARWGTNQLLHNRGDGTFDEWAAKTGLDIRGHTTSAVFADFDNDGDVDCLLGRSLEPSLYLINEEGTFVDRSGTLLAQPLPQLVSTVSAVDYNRDGLLDVYLSTYGFPNEDPPIRQWASRFLPADQVDEMVRRFGQSNRFLDLAGPPNVLLVNRGEGRFEVAPESDQLALWKSTLQATWSDFDNDGDVDLYVANDFARDYLFRNDETSGFTDVTVEWGGKAMLGFGMGASWGDYDNDGRRDLYVSNMYSKAGTRITEQVTGLDPRISHSALGNLLFRHQDERFELMSGPDGPEHVVAKAGWSWGGQFADFDNDGYQDIYVSSGYYTAPDEISLDVDL